MNRRPPSRNTSPNAVRKIALGTNTGARLTTSRRFRGARAVSGFRVRGDYFHTPAKYVTQVGWTKLWGASLKLDYDPIVHVAAVKPKGGGQHHAQPGGQPRRVPGKQLPQRGVVAGCHPRDQVIVHRFSIAMRRQPVHGGYQILSAEPRESVS